MGNCVLIMAGGTGGHVFPALAVARELRKHGVDVVWLGTHKGLEASVVPKAGIAMEWVSVAGLRGKHIADWLVSPFRLTAAIVQSLGVLRRRRPMAVLGMGGFVSGPGGLASRILRIPLVIHEQNAIAGMTNRWLAKLADRVLQAFPSAFPQSGRATTTGNPVRAEIASVAAPRRRYAQRTGPLRLLVIGGSLGAQALNESVPQALQRLPEAARPQVRHQTGIRNLEAAQKCYAVAGVAASVEPFIEDMASAYAWADLVLCRAGAMTVSELAAVGVPAILVPYPYAVDDHQTHNAKYLVDAGAASLLPQDQLSVASLCATLAEYGIAGCDDDAERCFRAARDRLLLKAEAARALAKPHAAQAVAQFCLEVGHA
jgi:UDP-N-acetylglucosamine--N-acetylmuramyl-(pentapeptide) pyrophosphoryl-undecaprenol N-acetylglucosamine transferase